MPDLLLLALVEHPLVSHGKGLKSLPMISKFPNFGHLLLLLMMLLPFLLLLLPHLPAQPAGGGARRFGQNA